MAVVNDPLTVGSGEFLPFEFPLAYWLEQHGYDVAYCSNSDMLTPDRELNCAAFISVGHDEYWDIPQFRSVETMRDNTQKPVVYFTGKEKGMTLNVTNKNAIVALYGQETDNWIGKPLILFPAMVDFQGQTVNAVRVRAPEPASADGDGQFRSSPGPQTAPAPQAPPPAVNSVTDLNDEMPF